GIVVPPGIADTVLPNPLFSLTPSATPDEGNNWINMSYGPLSLFNEALTSGMPGYNVVLGNYSINAGSPAINTGTATGAPNHDIYGTSRPQGLAYDIGAVEYVQPPLLGGGAPIDPLALGGSSGGGLLGLFKLATPILQNLQGQQGQQQSQNGR
ncbi:MAG TPA: choice-of-anchor Q domain-containing protein, partial [Vicinamibacterales bacterium]